MPNGQTQPAPEILEWVASIVGPCHVVSRFAHDHGYSNLWRLKAANDYVWLKMHAHPRKWAGEVHALTHWAAPVTPELLGWRDDPCAAILSEMPGMDAESIEFSAEAEAKLWSQAGDWLRQFHSRANEWMGDVQPDGTPWSAPLTDAMLAAQERMELRLFKGREMGLISGEEFDFATSQLREELPCLRGAGFHSTHRDFTTRNWLATSDGTLTAVIDFEHARWDMKSADLNRPWDWDFRRNPRLIDAFYDAYGQPNEQFMRQIQLQRLINVVVGIVWAAEVGDLAFSEFNRQALRRIMAKG